MVANKKKHLNQFQAGHWVHVIVSSLGPSVFWDNMADCMFGKYTVKLYSCIKHDMQVFHAMFYATMIQLCLPILLY